MQAQPISMEVDVTSGTNRNAVEGNVTVALVFEKPLYKVEQR